MNFNMFWGLIILVVLIWLVQRRWKQRKQLALAKQLKTNLKPWPIIGHYYKFLGNDEAKMRAWHDSGRDSIEMGGISKNMSFDHLFVSVADPAVAQILMTACLEKHDIMKFIFEFVVGTSSIIAPVPIWRRRRKIIASSFNSNNLAQFVDIFSAYSTAMVHRLNKEVNKDAFSFWKYITEYSIKTVCETVLGVKTDSRSNNFVSALTKLFEIGSYFLFRPWLHNNLTLRMTPYLNKPFEYKHTMREFISNIIKEKKKAIETKKYEIPTREAYEHTSKPSFLVGQLKEPEENHRFSDEELLDENITLVAAGSDTTATGVAFTVLLLTTYPDVQDKVYEELQEVFGDSDSPINLEVLPRLRYLEAVIKETLRLYPTVPVLFRRVTNDVQLPSGITLVKDCGVQINIWAIHRNPKYWGADAELFRPERFLDFTPSHPAMFMPFSYGPRNCVGNRFAMMSMKIVLSTLLRRYRVLTPHGVQPGTLPRTKYDLTLKHVHNYQIRIENRK